MNNQINDGGPAFPQPDLHSPNGEVEFKWKEDKP